MGNYNLNDYIKRNKIKTLIFYFKIEKEPTKLKQKENKEDMNRNTWNEK